MRVVLVDTSFWYAWIDTSDAQHAKAVVLWGQEDFPRVIAQPCLVELVTMLSRWTDPRRAASVARDMRAGLLASIIDISREDEAAGLTIIEKFANRRLTYADSTACALVRRLDIPRVLAFDHDYRVVLPEREVVGPE